MKKTLLSGIISFCATFIFAQNLNVSQDSLLEEPLLELTNMEMTSFSKKSENAKQIPSSIFIISEEQIRMSAARTFQELLKEFVPGFWSASNDYYETDLYVRNPDFESVLFMLDGTPVMDLMTNRLVESNFEIPLLAIQQIEIIRGSAGNVYGANSASGIVNIITKNKKKYDFIGQVQSGYPLHYELEAFDSYSISDLSQISVYAKYKSFYGFKRLPQIDKNSSQVPASEGNGVAQINSRFGQDDRKVTTASGGLNYNFEKKKFLFSTNTFFSISKENDYYSIYPSSKTNVQFLADTNITLNNGLVRKIIGDTLILRGEDSVYFKSYNNWRITANLKSSYRLSSKNNVSLQVSSNIEHVQYNLAGGFVAFNKTVDADLQDNISIGNYEVSFGGNTRFMYYDVNEIFNPDQLKYSDSKNLETLWGVFANGNAVYWRGVLKMYTGLKLEKKNSVHKRPYVSPMVKIMLKPNSFINMWVGYSQSFINQGYNTRKVEYTLYSTELKNFEIAVYDAVKEAVLLEKISDYEELYEYDIALDSANAFIRSNMGEELVEESIQKKLDPYIAPFNKTFNAAIVTVENTVPSSIRTGEAGVRINVNHAISLEHNFYYMQLSDGFTSSYRLGVPVQSKYDTSKILLPYYYGNFMKGWNVGMETVVQYIPSKKLSVNVSYTYTNSERSYQTNSYFTGISNYSFKQNGYPVIPYHVLRFNVCGYLKRGYSCNLGLLLSSKFLNSFETIVPQYQYEEQRFEPLWGEYTKNLKMFGENNHRLILNIKAVKKINDFLEIYLFGTDLLSKPFVESANQLLTVYPRQTGRFFGFGITFLKLPN